MRTPDHESPFERYMSERILFFAYLMCSSVSGAKALKTCLQFAIFNFSEKLQKIFEIGLKIWSVRTKIVSLKKYLERKNSQRSLCCLFVNLPTVKIWGQSDKFPMSFSFLQWKNWFEKTALNWCVNQTGNFYFWTKLKTAISLPIFNLFQWFLFYIRDFIWIITLTEKSKFEENCPSEDILWA